MIYELVSRNFDCSLEFVFSLLLLQPFKFSPVSFVCNFQDWGCVILREIDFLLKICWSIPCLHPSWKVHTSRTSWRLFTTIPFIRNLRRTSVLSCDVQSCMDSSWAVFWVLEHALVAGKTCWLLLRLLHLLSNDLLVMLNVVECSGVLTLSCFITEDFAVVLLPLVYGRDFRPDCLLNHDVDMSMCFCKYVTPLSCSLLHCVYLLVKLQYPW